ncbi:MAG: phosphate-starvation-inducible PsiE family protein [Deltaproteobacteria bacterium]|nr:phosphate-starvation-inducible PsiE family protein [Deltaproteobacteria bacterium]
MLSFIGRFQKIIVVSLIAMMVLTVFLTTIELAWMLILDITTEPMFLLEIQELLDLFGLFLLVLIGIELIETLRTYLTDREIHAEVVFTVALIAIGRKVIILDVKELPSLTLVGIAAIILAMSFGYFLLKYLRHHEKEDEAAGILKKTRG